MARQSTSKTATLSPKTAKSKAKPASTQEAKKRAYNSPVREQQAAETREKIIAAGSELVHSYMAWDWKNLNADAVAKQAGVGKRTVQRHFPTENVLRDAVLQRIVEESGIDLGKLQLSDYADTVANILRYLQSFTVTHIYPYDSTFKSLDAMRRDVLLQIVATATPDWPEQKRIMAAAMLDIFWQPTLHERLTATWGLNVEDAVSALTWLIKAIETGIRKDRLPEVSSKN